MALAPFPPFPPLAIWCRIRGVDVDDRTTRPSRDAYISHSRAAYILAHVTPKCPPRDAYLQITCCLRTDHVMHKYWTDLPLTNPTHVQFTQHATNVNSSKPQSGGHHHQFALDSPSPTLLSIAVFPSQRRPCPSSLSSLGRFKILPAAPQRATPSERCSSSGSQGRPPPAEGKAGRADAGGCP